VSHKRKPVVKPLPTATTELYWRGKVACEILDGLELPIQAQEPVKRFLWAVADYEASMIDAIPAINPEKGKP
jgi:hypothetical protein